MLDDILASMGDYHGLLLRSEFGYELCCLDEELGIRLTESMLHALVSRNSRWCLWCYKDARFIGVLRLRRIANG